MKLIHTLFTILAVCGMTATLAADPEDRQAGESAAQAPASGESGDAGDEVPATEALSTEQPVSRGGARGDEEGCHGGVCVVSCTCESGCQCWGSEPCEVLQMFAGLGGCTDLRCDSTKESCTCKIPPADSKLEIETGSGD